MREIRMSGSMSGEGKPPAACRSRSSALPRLYGFVLRGEVVPQGAWLQVVKAMGIMLRDLLYLILFFVLLVTWAMAWLVFHVAGVIHLLLVISVISLILHLFRGRRSA
jgi:hypothetical protein